MFIKRRAFTLIEMMVVIVIIAILASLVTIALNSARAKGRDTKRLNDIAQVQSALEQYYFDQGSYPSAITPGGSLVNPTTGKIYLTKIPSNPQPWADGGCANADYTYSSAAGSSYALNYCLATGVGGVAAGAQVIYPGASTGVTCTASCGAHNCGNDGCGGSCGTCAGGYDCSSGTCTASCSAENDPTFCSRLSKNCGSVTANDNCGTPRTVTSCGTCTLPQSCAGGGSSNVCGCTAENDPTFCSRLSKNCGSVTANDNCGTPRTVASCGTCSAPQTCAGGGSSNVCGCTAENDATFCSRLGYNCGSVTANDNCGTPRTVASCGTCSAPQTCAGATPSVANVCGCTPESDSLFCSNNVKACGSYTGTDICGNSKTVANCGTCGTWQTCTSNACGYGTTPTHIYHLDSNLTDSAGSPDNLTGSGTPAPTSTPADGVSGAYQFTFVGSNGPRATGGSTYTPPAAFTLDFEIKLPTPVANGVTWGPLGQSAGNCNGWFMFVEYVDATHSRLRIVRGSDTSHYNSYYMSILNSTLASWTRITYSFTSYADASPLGYVNAGAQTVTKITGAGTPGTPSGSKLVFGGAGTWESSNGFTGSLDEVYYFSAAVIP